MAHRVTRRWFLKSTAVAAGAAVGGVLAGGPILLGGQPKAAAGGGLIYRFSNKTGGKFKDDEIFWSLTNGRDWHAISQEPTVRCPGGGRIYFNLGKHPKNLDDFESYWDFVEFNCGGKTWHGNTTQVDAFCLPMTIEMGAKKMGLMEPRTKLFEAFRKEAPKEFKACVRGDFWIVSPFRADLGAGKPFAHYFEKYVDEVWEMYATEKPTPSGKFTGKAEAGGPLKFTPVGGGQAIVCAKKPTTQEILLGQGVLQPRPDFCAAFNRHVAADPADWRTPARFYQAEPCNWYSKFLHEHSIDHKAYGFCYDDFAEQAAFFSGTGDELGISFYWD